MVCFPSTLFLYSVTTLFYYFFFSFFLNSLIGKLTRNHNLIVALNTLQLCCRLLSTLISLLIRVSYLTKKHFNDTIEAGWGTPPKMTLTPSSLAKKFSFSFASLGTLRKVTWLLIVINTISLKRRRISRLRLLRH